MYDEKEKKLEILKKEMNENNIFLLFFAFLSFFSVFFCTTSAVYFDSSKWLSYIWYTTLIIVFCYIMYLNISTTKKYFACKKELNSYAKRAH